MNDALGDRMKDYEDREAGRRFLPEVPVIARLDGKCFSKFTNGLRRPYDAGLSRLMIEVTRQLVYETDAACGYTQSDEITLTWLARNRNEQIWFSGRVQKMNSVLAAACSVHFNRKRAEWLPGFKEDQAPVFDCRVWQVPSAAEAANCFLWRELDATKNSISMAASAHYSHKQLMNKNSSDKQELLFQAGVNWNDYPDFFKRGTFVQRRTVRRKLTPEDLESLPEKHEARLNPDLEVERNEIRVIAVPPFRKVTNRAGVIFNGEEPATEGAT